jgi:hypothetical protein
MTLSTEIIACQHGPDSLFFPCLKSTQENVARCGGGGQQDEKLPPCAEAVFLIRGFFFSTMKMREHPQTKLNVVSTYIMRLRRPLVVYISIKKNLFLPFLLQK